ncbi:alpha/beta fold hydrolase [Streptomyces sp. NPDC059637]|uniref:alpha/beta fold hydrolase n=1 Tax=Streptomyces sp. NPDC059637 TaxID=3347752 RepID=UPI0036C5C039
MTAFILVPGTFTGGWAWEEVAARLRASGAEAHPVTLTGTGDGRNPAEPGTDLETHVADLVRLIDGVDDPEIVMVGHDYGIHPVFGAADRRPQRIARIVCLDVAVPRDGDPALVSVPDQALRDRLLEQQDGRAGAGQAGDGQAGDEPAGDGPSGDEPAGDGRWVAPPAPGEWARTGSTDGVPADALDRLARLAAPQPLGTLVQPLRLTGAAAGIPTTGVLCTANGASIAMVEALVGFGDPRFLELTRPGVTFFELATGHWPMLSRPDELAEVLIRAAAGEGHVLAAPADRRPAHLRPFLLDVPERPRERTGRVDLHLPDADGPRPAVVFVHGGPVPAEARPTPRDWPTLVGYAQYVAGLGAVGVTLDHRLHDVADYGQAAGDVAEAVELVRADPRVDGERVALWFFSGGGPLSADWLAAPPSWLRCVAATYPVLAPLPGWGHFDSRFRPVAAVRTAGRLPVVLTRVGKEDAGIAATVEEFLAAAGECGADVEVVDVPNGRHGFETIDHTEEARRAVDRAVRSVLAHLRD